MRMCRSVARIMICLLILVSLCSPSLPTAAFAASAKGYPVTCVAMDQSGKIVAECIGVPFTAGEINIVFTSPDFYVGDYIYALIVGAEEYYKISYQGTESTGGVAVFAFSGSNINCCYEPGLITVGETATLVGTTSDGKVNSYSLQIEDYNQSPVGTYQFYQMDVSSSGEITTMLPAPIVNDAGELVGFAGTDGGFYALIEPQSGGGTGGGSSGGSSGSSSGGSSGGSSNPSRPDPSHEDEKTSDNTIITVAVAAIVFIAVVVIVRKKKNTVSDDDKWIDDDDDNAQDTVADSEWKPSDDDTDADILPEEKVKIKLYLMGVGGPVNGQTYPISDSPVLIGRAVEANIRYPADTKGVSRRHCQVFWKNGAIMVMDLGSSAGTYLSGKGKLQPNVPVALKKGSKIYLGSKNIALAICAKEIH